MRFLKTVLPFWALLCLLPQSAAAHNVVGGVYAIGDQIEGEAGFTNGAMAPAGLVVQVTDAMGTSLGSTTTEPEGVFRYQARQRIDHHFHLDMGAGHQLHLSLPGVELPASLPGGEPVTAAGSAALPAPVDQAALQAAIETAVARQITPLRKELNAYKEKAGLQDLLGGIGYIFGLCGLVIMLRQRKAGRAATTESAD